MAAVTQLGKSPFHSGDTFRMNTLLIETAERTLSYSKKQQQVKMEKFLINPLIFMFIMEEHLQYPTGTFITNSSQDTCLPDSKKVRKGRPGTR